MVLLPPPEWKPAVEVRFVMDKSHGRWLVTVRNVVGQGTEVVPQVIDALREVQKALTLGRYKVDTADAHQDTVSMVLDASD